MKISTNIKVKRYRETLQCARKMSQLGFTGTALAFRLYANWQRATLHSDHYLAKRALEDMAALQRYWLSHPAPDREQKTCQCA